MHRRFQPVLLSLLLSSGTGLAAGPAPAPQAAAAANAIRIPYERFVLPNGLTTILSVDRSTPTVAVEVWYHVGSKNELPGRTGFAHLFEHIMFTGSGHVPYGVHDKLTNGVGGNNNGTTNNDRTMYYETVPSNYLQSTLWLESDRMGFLLDSLDLTKINAQRDIVKNERRQRMDNQPYGRASEILAHATYPASNPYSWDVIGSMTDLSAASEEDVKNFFRQYYVPNNAYLSIAGDFDPAQAKAWVREYFGDLRAGQTVERPQVAPAKLTEEKDLVFDDRVQVPRLYIQWPTVGVKSDDQYALALLGEILTGSRTARLTKALVYDQQAAAQIFARQESNEDVGQFLMITVPRPGHSLTDILAEIDKQLAALKSSGPDADELKKAKAGEEVAFLTGIQSNQGKATILASSDGYHGNPGYFKTDYEKSQAVTAADIKRVADTYLTPGRVVLSIVPIGKDDMAAKPDKSTKVTGETGSRTEVKK